LCGGSYTADRNLLTSNRIPRSHHIKEPTYYIHQL